MGRRLQLLTRFEQLQANMVVVDIACVCGRVHDVTTTKPVMTQEKNDSIAVSWECVPRCVEPPPGFLVAIDRNIVAQHRIFTWVDDVGRSVARAAAVKASR